MEKEEFTDFILLLNEINNNLLEIRRLFKLNSLRGISELINSVLDTTDKRVVYELMDGKLSVRDIAEISKINKSTISEWGQYWETIGMVYAEDIKLKRKRCKVFSLSELGLSTEVKKSSER